MYPYSPKELKNLYEQRIEQLAQDYESPQEKALLKARKWGWRLSKRS